MRTFIVQYLDNNLEYQGFQIDAQSFQDAIDCAKRTIVYKEILGCFALGFIRSARAQKGIRPNIKILI